MSAHTDADRKAVIDAINAHRSPTYVTGVVHDGPDCLANDILDAVTPAIEARALREAAEAIERTEQSCNVKKSCHLADTITLRERAEQAERAH